MMTPTELSSRLKAMAAHAGADELDHFAGHDAGQAVDAGDAVAHFEHPAHLARCPGVSRNCSISVCRTETISSALNLMTASRKNLFLHVIQVVAHGASTCKSPMRIFMPPSSSGAHTGVQNRILLKDDCECARSGRADVIGQGHGRLHQHAQAVLAFVVDLMSAVPNRPHQVEPIVGH